jgi:thymidylate synthase (FAD)
MDKAAMVVPTTIQRDVQANSLYDTAMEYAKEAYKQLQALGIPDEDARFVLPNATATNLILTANLNALIVISSDRLCSLAQLEIRKLFAMIRNRTIKALPFMRNHIVIKCMRTGFCTESRNKDNHCGVRPHKDSVLIVPKPVNQNNE